MKRGKIIKLLSSTKLLIVLSIFLIFNLITLYVLPSEYNIYFKILDFIHGEPNTENGIAWEIFFILNNKTIRTSGIPVIPNVTIPFSYVFDPYSTKDNLRLHYEFKNIENDTYSPFGIVVSGYKCDLYGTYFWIIKTCYPDLDFSPEVRYFTIGSPMGVDDILNINATVENCDRAKFHPIKGYVTLLLENQFTNETFRYSQSIEVCP